MQLNENGLKDREKWESAGYRLPGFDRIKVAEETKKDPFWIHFGAGNIFRAFQANVVQELLDSRDLDRGLIFCGANAWRCNKMETVQDIMKEFA